MVNDDSIYCVLFSEQAELVNFIPIVRHCFQNRIFSYNLSLLSILAIVTVVAAVCQSMVFIGHIHLCTQFIFIPSVTFEQSGVFMELCYGFIVF